VSDPLKALIESLTLERLEENLFRGAIGDTHIKRIYGGKVLGESLKAAQSTVEERTAHSIHAYFLREADAYKPVIYEVDRSRDGRSFSSRRVVAIQAGRPIFTMEASFHKQEDGIEYQERMPDVVPYREVEEISFSGLEFDAMSPRLQRIATISAPFEIRPIDTYFDSAAPGTEPMRRLWVRSIDALPDDPDLHRAMLAYLSDYGLITTLLMPLGKSLMDDEFMLASLDHAMWFHRPFRLDEWLLYVCEGIAAYGSRGLARGRFYDERGTLVVSTAQEGLIRRVT
jgi:acyl-CoA thioesterase-2